ncbi:MAG TPA: uroporphyrinogen-III synthase [Terriglobales bacterium]|jgi:uroporphyrinogen-III synthase|nr:uroporphyrinogen-III synthase [Terriglobales bacterium]
MSSKAKSRGSNRARLRKSALPLAGLRVLVTRTRKQAGTLSTMLRKQGATVREIPTIEIRPPQSWSQLDEALRRHEDFEWLILTSVNGVEALAARCRKLRLPVRKLNHLKIAAIGPATKKALEKCGLKVSVVPSEYVAEAVVEKLQHKVKGKRVLLVRAAIARDVIPRQLKKAGAEVTVTEAYHTVAPASSRRKLQSIFSNPQLWPHVVTFTSSSTVRNFHELMRGVSKDHMQNVATASVGPVTSSTLRECGYRVDMQAREYTMPGLVKAIVRWRRNVAERAGS